LHAAIHEPEYQNPPSFVGESVVAVCFSSIHATRILAASGESSTLLEAKAQIRRSGDPGMAAALRVNGPCSCDRVCTGCRRQGSTEDRIRDTDSGHPSAASAQAVAASAARWIPGTTGTSLVRQNHRSKTRELVSETGMNPEKNASICIRS